MIEYLIPLVFAVLGFGVAWFIWGRADVVAPTELAAPKKAKRTIRRPVKKDKHVGAGPSPFRVVTLDGEVVYDGVSGGEARRCIERLRKEDVEWRAYRDGIVWDWGPRE